MMQTSLSIGHATTTNLLLRIENLNFMPLTMAVCVDFHDVM